jgi:hypothetical protein
MATDISSAVIGFVGVIVGGGLKTGSDFVIGLRSRSDERSDEHRRWLRDARTRAYGEFLAAASSARQTSALAIQAANASNRKEISIESRASVETAYLHLQEAYGGVKIVASTPVDRAAQQLFMRVFEMVSAAYNGDFNSVDLQGDTVTGELVRRFQVDARLDVGLDDSPASRTTHHIRGGPVAPVGHAIGRTPAGSR